MKNPRQVLKEIFEVCNAYENTPKAIMISEKYYNSILKFLNIGGKPDNFFGMRVYVKKEVNDLGNNNFIIY